MHGCDERAFQALCYFAAVSQLDTCVRVVMSDLGTPSHFRSKFASLFCLALAQYNHVDASCQVHSSVSNVASCAAAGPPDKYEESSTMPDSATAVMPTSSFCRASPRFSDHLLNQGLTLMIVSSFPLERSCEQLM